MRARLGLAVFIALAACQPSSGPAWVSHDAKAIPGRWGHAAVYDPSRDRMLIFGGQGAGGTQLNDTWALDLSTFQWTQISTGHGPSPRANMAGVLDPTGDRLIVIGGRQGGSTPLAETWALDLKSNSWTQLASGFVARYDLVPTSDGQHAWVFGGVGEIFQSLQDLWQLDFATNAWTQLPPNGSVPDARGSSSMAVVDGGVFLYGGHDWAMVHRDGWRYDLAAQSWSQLQLTGTTAAAAHFGYAFDAQCQALYMSAGDNLDNYDLAITDALSIGSAPAVSRIPASTLPPPRDHSTMILDPTRRVLVLYGGGEVGDGMSLLNDLWTYQLGPCQ